MDNLKSQFLTISALKGGNISEVMYSLVYIILIEQIIIYIPIVVAFIKKTINDYLTAKSKKFVSKISSERPILSTIVIKRNYENQTSEDIVPDSLINFITNTNNVGFLEYVKGYYPNTKKVFEVTNSISSRLISLEKTDKDDIKSICFELFSCDLTLKELRSFIENIAREYDIKKRNKLGNSLFYFNEIIQPIQMNPDGSMNYGTANKNMKFTFTEFNTNKTLDNIYGESIKTVKERIDFFTNNESWYKEKGIPYTLGLLLYGDPGCGKTSLIKAIANITGRHILNISIHEFATRTQFNNLFYNEKLYIESDKPVPENCIIPNNKRLYVIEDIDAMSSIVHERTKSDTTCTSVEEIITPPEKQTTITGFGKPKNSKSAYSSYSDAGYFDAGYSDSSSCATYKAVRTKLENDQINLSFLLNILDGVLETPGRILIMTSNHPEKLDKALIRPGRIDLAVNFTKCSSNTIKEMFSNFYKQEIDTSEIPENHWTPAKVSQVLIENINDPEIAVEMLRF